MKTLRYTGPHDGVYVPLPGGMEASCERDGTVEVPDDVAAGLLEQPENWTLAKAGKKEG